MHKPFGIYIHIPYCLQRCTYCDFATYVHTEILPAEKYIELVKKEITLRRHYFGFKPGDSIVLDTLYFGGGTPSLISAELIINLIQELNKQGFLTRPSTEITLEINPATVDEKKLNLYLQHGVNRFSVGAQTFHDRLLKMVKREHSAEQTRQTLALLRSYDLNFSFDLLFALPTQTVEELKADVQQSVELGSRHISPYCLTVPEGHPLSYSRPIDDDQVEMFSIIDQQLNSKNFQRYEISNYSLPGFESRHNSLYWNDHSYWGLGLSAHSYSLYPLQNSKANFGHRFWNPNNINLYENQILSGLQNVETSNIEHLELHQALTDFCHTSLRISTGLNFKKIDDKFGPSIQNKIRHLAEPLIEKKLLQLSQDAICLTTEGNLISNQIFEHFTFLKNDLI